MRTGLLLAVAASIAAGCGGQSVSGPTPVVVSVSITGPSSIAPGATAAFSAVAHMSDGSTQDYTTKATWRTNNIQILAISSTGQATAGIVGETFVTAVAQSRSATMNVVVIPAGTFRLTGTVTESGLPVASATVAVTSGIGTGLSTTTSFEGQYRIYGVSGEIELTVSKTGYTPTVQPATVTTASVIDVSIVQSGGVRDLTGTYALRIAADTGCGTGPTLPFPDDLKERRYTATVTQTGVTLRVQLSGAAFEVKNGVGDSFSARIEPGQITFVLGDGYYTPYPDILESLGDGRDLLISGSGTFTSSGSDLAGTMDGSLALGNSKQPVWSRAWYMTSCYSQNLTMAMTRQPGTPARIRR